MPEFLPKYENPDYQLLLQDLLHRLHFFELDILKKESFFQSHKLKKRLFAVKIKPMHCEECGWNKTSKDGRLPLELHHVNGDSRDNRIENLISLCPNCHSLQPTHRGRNKKVALARVL